MLTVCSAPPACTSGSTCFAAAAAGTGAGTASPVPRRPRRRIVRPGASRRPRPRLALRRRLPHRATTLVVPKKEQPCANVLVAREIGATLVRNPVPQGDASAASARDARTRRPTGAQVSRNGNGILPIQRRFRCPLPAREYSLALEAPGPMEPMPGLLLQ